MSTQEQNNFGGRGQGSNRGQTQKHRGGRGGRGGNASTMFKGATTRGALKEVYICLGDSRTAQFARMEKLFVTYALSRKETKVAIIIKTNTPLGTIKDFMDDYPTGADVNKQNIEVWK